MGATSQTKHLEKRLKALGCNHRLAINRANTVVIGTDLGCVLAVWSFQTNNSLLLTLLLTSRLLLYWRQNIFLLQQAC